MESFFYVSWRSAAAYDCVLMSRVHEELGSVGLRTYYAISVHKLE